MVDFARFGVELVDKVSAPARQAASELDRIEKKLAKSKTLATLTNNEVKKLASARVGGAIKKQFDGAANALIRWGKYGVISVAAAGTAVGVMVTQSVVSMGMFADASRRAFASLTGSAQMGNQAFEVAVDTAKQLGLDVQQTVGQYQKLLAMQFSLADASDQVKLAADLQAVGTSAENTQRALIALTQIKAKGRLQSEELVGQLAEAGVSTTLVYQALARQLGKTEAEVRKLISAGKVSGDQGIAAIKEAIMHKVHETRAGEAAEAFSKSTLSGMLNRMQAAPNRLWLRTSEGIASAIGRLAPLMQRIEQYIDNIDARKIGDFVVTVLEAVEKIVPLALEFADGFGEGFKELFAGMQGFATTEDDLKTAHDLGRNLAKAFGLIAEACLKIVEVISWMGTPLGRIVTETAVFSLLGFKVLSPFVKMGSAIWKAVGALKAARVASAALAATQATDAATAGLASALGTSYRAAPVGAAAQPGFWSRIGGYAAGFFRSIGRWLLALGPMLMGWLAPAGAWITGTLVPMLSGAATAVVGFFAAIPLALAAAVTAAVASIGYLGYVIYQNWDELGRAFSYVWDQCVAKAKELGGAIVDAFKSGLGAIGNLLMTGSFSDTQGTRGLDVQPALKPPTLSPQAAGAISNTQNIKADFTVNVNGNATDGKQVGEAAASSLKSKVMDMFEHHKLAMGA